MAHSYPYSSYFLAINAFLIFVIHAGVLQAKSIVNDEPVCMSENCRHTADRLLNNMNQNEDPCDSFYEYACGNWSDEKASVVHLMMYNVEYQLKELLNDTSSPKNSTLAKVQQFYKSCINTANNKAEDKISQIFTTVDAKEGWPLMMTEDEWLSKNKSWYEVDITFLKNFGFSLYSEIKVDTSSIHNLPFIRLNPTQDPLQENILSKHFVENFDDFLMIPQIGGYISLIEDIIETSQDTHNGSLISETFKKDVEDILKLEWELELIKRRTIDEPGRNNAEQWHVMSIDQFQSNYSSISIDTLDGKIDLPNMIKQYLDVFSQFNISGSENIGIPIDYLSEITDLFNRTPSKVIVNTIYIKFVKKISEGLLWTKPISKSPLKITVKEQHCIERTKSFFPHLINHFYIQKYSSDVVVNKTREMLSNIRYGMEIIINRSSLSDQRKKLWLTIADKIPVLVGYPILYMNDTFFDNEYEDFNTSESYFNNVGAVNKFNLIKNLQILEDHIDRYAIWPGSLPVEVQAFYNNFYRRIFVNYAYLQNPYFDIEQPNVLNYGGDGNVIGHELGHSLYTLNDKHFPKNGGLGSSDADNDTKLLDENIECLIRRYSNYSVSLGNMTLKLNPHRTLKENLADVIGIQAGYTAFQIHKKNHIASRIRLPGLEHLNSNQLFFLAYASDECESKDVNQLVNNLKDAHAPSRFRVDGTLSSSSIFAKAFHCPVGTRMNPVEKCVLSSR